MNFPQQKLLKNMYQIKAQKKMLAEGGENLLPKRRRDRSHEMNKVWSWTCLNLVVLLLEPSSFISFSYQELQLILVINGSLICFYYYWVVKKKH